MISKAPELFHQSDKLLQLKKPKSIVPPAAILDILTSPCKLSHAELLFAKDALMMTRSALAELKVKPLVNEDIIVPMII